MKDLFPRRRKRTKEEIVASVLASARYGANKTRIKFRSFLSTSQLQKYLSYTLSMGLLDMDSKAQKYVTTYKGMEYLKHFEEACEIENTVIEKKRLLSEILKTNYG